jgi:predicted XRE-type DNA-binding protein
VNERPDIEHIKAQLAAEVLRLIGNDRSAGTESNDRAHLPAINVSAIRSGDLAQISIDDLVAFLNDLDQQVAVTVSPALPRHGRSLLEKIAAITASIPRQDWEKLPVDLAVNHDHYLHGAPKRD